MELLCCVEIMDYEWGNTQRCAVGLSAQHISLVTRMTPIKKLKHHAERDRKY